MGQLCAVCGTLVVLENEQIYQHSICRYDSLQQQKHGPQSGSDMCHVHLSWYLAGFFMCMCDFLRMPCSIELK